MGARVVYVHRTASRPVARARALSHSEHQTLRAPTALGNAEIHPLAQTRRFDVLDTYQPKAVVFIEKTGPNARGVHHSIMGSAKDPNETGHAFYLADLARERGIVTIGVGDGGNEIGNGMIYEAVRRIQPYGPLAAVRVVMAWRRSRPLMYWCRPVSRTGEPMASLRNWRMSCKTWNCSRARKWRTLCCASVVAGGTDGAYAAQILYVDGTSARIQRALVAMLREIVHNGLKKVYRGF